MKFPKIFVENGKTAGEILLDVLQEEQIVTESFHKRLTSIEMISESEDTHKSVYMKGKRIDRDIFEAVYSNVKNFPTKMDVVKALGFNEEDFGAERRQRDNLNKFFERLVRKFNGERLEDQEQFPQFSKRKQYYTAGGRDDAEDTFGDATIDDINAGSRSRKDRTTRTVDRINSEDLLNGEFYANMSRIPKTRWSGWLRFWDRKKSSVARDKTLLGREWGKSFILGYQVERNLLYEIWYNSIDSTFTVHDGNGTEMSNRVKTMTEAIKTLVGMIAQTSSSDAEVFRGTTQQNKQLAQSIQRALYTDLDRRADELEKIDRKKQVNRRKEKQDELRRRRKAQQEIKNLAKTPDRDAYSEVGEDPQNADIKNSKSGNVDREVKRKQSNVPNEQARKNADASMEKDRQRKDALDKQAAKQRLDQVSRDVPSMTGQNSDEFGVDVPEFVSKADQRKLEKQRKQRAREKTQAKKKSMNQRKPEDTAEERAERTRREIEQAREKIRREDSPSDDVVTESFDGEDFEEQLEQRFDSSQYDSQVKSIKNQAERSPYTQMALNQTVMGELVTTYDETKVKKSFSTKLGRMLNRGRKEPIVLPTDKPSAWERIKMAFRGQRYRADFIIGWSLGGKVDLEIWYITEPHPDYDGSNNRQKTIASFYVFDVSSATVIRRYLPYYRNAVQVVLGKIGAF